MTRDAIVALFARRDEAWQRRELDGLIEHHAENATWESPMQGRVEGRARIAQVYRTWLEAFPDLTYTTTDLLIDDHRAVQLFTVAGTQAGPFAGVAPTGRRIQFRGATIYTFDPNGLIIHTDFLYDFTKMLIQLGVLKTKAGN